MKKLKNLSLKELTKEIEKIRTKKEENIEVK